MTIQFSRGLVLAKTETTFNEAIALAAADDAFEVINPDFTPDITGTPPRPWRPGSGVS